LWTNKLKTSLHVYINNKEEIRCSGKESGLLQSHTAQPYILTVLFVLLLVVLRVQYTQMSRV